MAGASVQHAAGSSPVEEAVVVVLLCTDNIRSLRMREETAMSREKGRRTEGSHCAC